jgi:hypothetical protein
VANGPFRLLWALAYRFATSAYAGYLCRGERGASAYVRGSLGSGQPLYGLSDIDMVVVLAGEGRERVRRRVGRAQRLPPPLRALVEWPAVYEEPRLAQLAPESALTCREAAYGPDSDDDEIRLLERPGLDGPSAGWRLVRGPERRPPADSRAPEHVAAWLELQYWWRTACEGCIEPNRLGAAALCVKLAAEPAAIWLRLARGERPAGREQALRAAARELPGEAEAFERALWLRERLSRSPQAPLRESLALLIRVSGLIAAELRSRAPSFTRVRLEPGELTCVRPYLEPLDSIPWAATAELRPLADFRAIAGRPLPDEALAPLDADPADPEHLAQLARGLSGSSVYPELRAGELSIRPAIGGRARLRAIQCALTDPVSFAHRDDVASFPDLPGWSAHDVARRAVAEHRAWLEAPPHDPDGRALGRLATAARAARFLQSIEGGEPALPLTVAAALAPLDEAARQAYEHFGVHGTRPQADVVARLERTVLELPAYRS